MVCCKRDQLQHVFLCIHFILQLVLNVIAEMIGSWWLAMILEASHVVSEVSGVLPNTQQSHDINFTKQFLWDKNFRIL